MMKWQLVGANSNELYYESDEKEDIHRWLQIKYPFKARKNSIKVTTSTAIWCNMPEPMKIRRNKKTSSLS